MNAAVKVDALYWYYGDSWGYYGDSWGYYGDSLCWYYGDYWGLLVVLWELSVLVLWGLLGVLWGTILLGLRIFVLFVYRHIFVVCVVIFPKENSERQLKIAATLLYQLFNMGWVGLMRRSTTQLCSASPQQICVKMLFILYYIL